MSLRLYVPDIPELAAVVTAGRALPGCRVRPPRRGYWTLEADSALAFERKPMGLGPALWNSLLCGGYCGEIREYGRDRLVLAPETRP